jgi:hypothetical protein
MLMIKHTCGTRALGHPRQRETHRTGASKISRCHFLRLIHLDIVARARMTTARLFSKWYTDLRNGRHVVVVVVGEGGTTARHWIVTAYTARTLGEGEVAWQRS